MRRATSPRQQRWRAGSSPGSACLRAAIPAYPKNRGSTASDVARSSARDTVNRPCTSTASEPWSTTPMRTAGSPRASHIEREAALLGARHGHQHPARGFGEQHHKRIRRPREARCGNRFHPPAPIRRPPAPGRLRTSRAPRTPARRARPSSAPRPAAARAPGRPRAAARPDGRRSPAPRSSRRTRRGCRRAESASPPVRCPAPVGMRRRTSSMTPSTPTTGVGRIAVDPVWL